MSNLLKALKELNKLDESFNKSEEHYAKHVCPSIMQLENKFREVQRSLYPNELFYVGLTPAEYINEAKKLSNEDFVDATKTTTTSGVSAFKGAPTEEWPDCFYIIRNPSSFINKNFFIKTFNSKDLGESVWNAYVEHAGTDEFVDVCITKGEDEFANTSNKSILTFYPAPASKIEKLKDNCLNYYDERGQLNQARKEQCLVMIPPYYIENPNYGLRGYVVKPTSIRERQLDRGERGIDNMLSYKKGKYIYNDVLISFSTEEETTRLKDKEGKNYALSSRSPKIAKETFTKAACKDIFNTETSTTFRQRYIENTVYIWVSDIYEIGRWLDNEPKIKELVADRLGIDEQHDYVAFRNIILKLYSSLKKQWEKLNEKEG